MVLITQHGPDTILPGSPAPQFRDLAGVDGRLYSLSTFDPYPVLVVIFTCNHCPYAQAYEDRLVALANSYQSKGVGFIAINPNKTEGYPEDSLEAMKRRAAEKHFPFPYVRDDSQAVAKAFGAVCTPHIFVFDRERKLAYEGRIDDNWKAPTAVRSHDLKNALDDLLAGRTVRVPQAPPMGCSIKWKSA
jgi:peroxiredoxin